MLTGIRLWWRRLAVCLLILAAVFAFIAYVALPFAWREYELGRKPHGASLVTRTAQGIHGDPLNVALFGDRADLLRAMHAAGWYPADPITWRSSLEIVGSVLFDRPYREAPVSSLYLLGRREDLAFEKPEGRSADRRGHVRFWNVLKVGENAGQVWLGSATFDRGVGISHYTGAVTHYIAPDVDVERDRLIDDLWRAGMLSAIYEVMGMGPTRHGRNGEGDRYVTDGEIRIGSLAGGAAMAIDAGTPEVTALPDVLEPVWNETLEALEK